MTFNHDGHNEGLARSDEKNFEAFIVFRVVRHTSIHFVFKIRSINPVNLDIQYWSNLTGLYVLFLNITMTENKKML